MLAGVTWDDAMAELRVTLDDRSSPMPLPAQAGLAAAGADRDRRPADRQAGGLPVGARIQSEVTLADRLGISRPTMSVPPAWVPP